MIAADPVAVVARYRAVHQRKRLSELAPAAIEPPSEAELRSEREHLDDALRPEVIGPAVRVAAAASPGRAGERARQPARALISLYLDRACADHDAEIAERIRRKQSFESLRAARHEARDGAARALDMHSAFDLTACAEPRDPRLLADEVERDAAHALDDAIQRVSMAGTLVDFESCLDRVAIAPRLRELGVALGEDSDTQGPRLIRGDAPWDIAIIPPGERACVVTGSTGGPSGLRSALRAFAVAAHGGAVGRRRGAIAFASSDAAFAAAAEISYARLVRSAPFRSWAGLREEKGLLVANARAEAEEIRNAWSRLRDAARGFPSDHSPETEGAAVLRGAIFAVLLEEHLMTRHGRRWFIDRPACRRLAEMWEAEPDETAESMADALSLGKMTADVLLEGFRP